MSDIGANIGVGGNTFVSTPGSGGNAPQAAAQPNGAGLPGANMPVTTAALIPLGVSIGGLAALYYLFRRGGAPLPPLRIDAVEVIKITFAAEVGRITLNLLAYKFHGHKVAQQWLLIS